MDQNDAQRTFEEAAEQLARLQKQLLSYQSALETLDGVGKSTEAVADAAEKVAAAAREVEAGILELQKAQAAVKKSLEYTFQTANFVKEKAAEMPKTFDEMGARLEKRLAAALEARGGDLSGAGSGVGGSADGELGRELRQLRFLTMGVGGLVVILFLIAIMFMPASGPAVATPVRASGPVAADRPAAAPAVRIQILNGCGVSGVASRFEQFLEVRGYAVSGTDNADRFTYEQTLVRSTAAAAGVAADMARQMGVPPSRVVELLPADSPHDVVVVVGRDYEILAPAAQ